MMENLLFPLNNVNAAWLTPSFTTWAMDMILAFACGLGIFLLLLHRLQGDSSFPPPRKKEKPRKHVRVKKVLYKSRKKNGTLKASGNRLKTLKAIQDMMLLLQSLLGKLRDKDSSPQLLQEDTPGEVFKQGPAGVHKPPYQHLEDPSTTLSPLASLTSRTNHTLPLTTSLSEHEDQSDLNRTSLAIAPQGSLPGHSYWESLATAISGLDCTSYSISFLSWWWATAKLLFFSTWVHGKSKQEHLFHHPSDPTLWVDPTRWQVESGGHSVINSDVQTLLEMLITKRVELKGWKENVRNGASFKQMSSDYTVCFLGNMLKSLDSQRDTTAQSFWNSKGTPQKLHDSQDFSYHKALGGPLEQKYSQLFWGLPSLHSESLVTTARVSKRSSTSQHNVVAFNKVPETLSAQYQNEEPPQLSLKEPLAQEEAQSQTLAQNLSPSVSQGQTLASTSYSFLNRPHSSSSQIKTGRPMCTKPEKETQSFIPTEDQHLECPLQNQLEWKKVSFSEIQKTQEVIHQPTLNLPQGSWASKISRSASIVAEESTSQELEQHNQQMLLRDKQQLGPPCRFLASQEQVQLQDKFPGESPCQKKDKTGPSQPTQTALAGKGVMKTESKHSERIHTVDSITSKLDLPCKGLEPEMQRQPVDLSWSSGSTSGKVQNDNKEDSESYLRTRNGVSESDLPTGPGKKILVKALEDHLGKKLVQIMEGIIPVYVRGSWLAANSSFPKSSVHTKSIHLASSKNQQSYVNSSQQISFLDPGTHLKLETHIMRSRVRRRWCQNLQALDPINCNLGEVQTSPLPQPAFSSSGSSDYRATPIAKVASLIEELPQKALGRRVVTKTSFPILQSPLLAPSPSEEQRTWRGTPLGGSHRTSEVCMPSQLHTCSLLNMKEQDGVIMGIEKASLKPSPGLNVVRYDTQKESKDVSSGEPCHCVANLEIKVGTQSSRAEETKETEVEKKKSSEWEVTVESSVRATSQTIYVNLENLGSLGNRKSPSPSRISISQDPGDPNLKVKDSSAVQLKVEIESEKQPQDQVTGVLQDCHRDELFTTDISPSQTSLSNSQSLVRMKKSISTGQCDVLMKEGSSQGQKESKVTNVEVPRKIKNAMLCPNDKTERFGRPRPGEEEDNFQDCDFSPSANVKEMDTISRKSFPCLPEKGQYPPGSSVKTTVKDFLQSFYTYKKGKGKKESLNKVEVLRATTQTQRSVSSKLSKENGVVEPQALMTLVGQILMDKLGLQHRSGPTEFCGHKKEYHTPAGRQSCQPRCSSYPEERQMIRDIASAQANPKGHSPKNKWIRDTNLTWKPRNPEPPVTPFQHRPIGVSSSSHLHHYPTCFFQNGFLRAQPVPVSHDSPDGNPFIKS